MARQYQLPGVGFIQADEDGRQYQIPGGGYFSDETVGGGGGGTFKPFWLEDITLKIGQPA